MAASTLLKSVLDTIDANVALLDADGTIVHVNQAWRRFAQRQNLAMPNDGIGSNYFESAHGCPGPGAMDAQHIVAALRELSDGRRESFECEYPCHDPEQRRWFAMRANRLSTNSPRIIVHHTDITEAKLARMESEQRFQRLTQRENEILHLIAAGKSSKQIAGEFNISVRTVENHRHHILTKTRAENVADLVRLAAFAGLLSDTDHTPPQTAGPASLDEHQPARLTTETESAHAGQAQGTPAPRLATPIEPTRDHTGLL